MKTRLHTLSLIGGALAMVTASALWSPEADARPARGGGGGAHAGGGHAGGARAGGGRPQVNNARADSRTRDVRSNSVNNVSNRSANVNRNTNINSNRNVNVNVDRGGCCGWDNDYHPVATAAAVTATVAVTSAVVGSIVRTVPSGCSAVNYGGMIYQQCGATWYQPQGSQYIVVNPPY
ncbi:hypothetical protein QTH91_15520 [Variovorax dokdonensis]|uniref:Uncharacterized protein n=1 Tax=Variovorax dokdonensis TaxID=344883 RepID=A0ABT7ND74_9BURK|nr:hypothetical protein [Variovorax dokdonensis]MDM0045897.1 hypothetical protein [Variovorax dokdonensis]